jgi:nucleoside-diphosphate-sugar epimerase
MRSESPGSRRALVAGAAGYLGGSVVRALTAAGWEVRGLVRRPESSARVEEAGGVAVVGSILDSHSVDAALRGCELAVHVAASGSASPEDPRRAEHVRVGGCRILLRGARTQGVRRVVVGSGYWVYADQPGTITEESEVDPRGESFVNWMTERVALDPGFRGTVETLVVRPGMVYGDGSWFRPLVESIRDGSYRYIDGGSNAWSFVSLEDAGTAFAHVAEVGAPGEVYNLVDGRPAPWREFGDFVAGRIARPSPPSISMSEASAGYGGDVAHHLHARRACSSAKIARLGWTPRSSDFREGLSELLAKMAGVPPPG